MKESEVSLDVRFDLGARPDTRLFRNNVGTFLQVNGPTEAAIKCLRENGFSVTVTKVGLCPGSSDIIGWHSRVVTPEMVGSKVALFTGIETKLHGGRTDPKRLESQMLFINTVKKFGGLAGIATSVDEARSILGL